MDSAPDDSRIGYSGWKDSEDIAADCTLGMERVCWISRTSGRSLVRFEELTGVLDKDPAL